ncbi:MAG: hypothetical protein ACRYHB_11710 [Janthinobacterium lividum]
MHLPAARDLLEDLCSALEDGTLRMVQGDGLGRWRVQGWIKRALMMLSSGGTLQKQPGALPGTELDSLGWSDSRPALTRVPAGSFIRRGAYLAPGSAIMPPSTVQVGAAILDGAMIDSHVLIGTAVLVGEGTVVGCGTMLAGSLLPEDALPVVVERSVVIGGNCGLYGSMVVGERASIFAGTIIRSAGGLFHATRREWLLADAGGTLRVPPGCTVSMGLPPADAFPDAIQRLTPMITD